MEKSPLRELAAINFWKPSGPTWSQQVFQPIFHTFPHSTGRQSLDTLDVCCSCWKLKRLSLQCCGCSKLTKLSLQCLFLLKTYKAISISVLRLVENLQGYDFKCDIVASHTLPSTRRLAPRIPILELMLPIQERIFQVHQSMHCNKNRYICPVGQPPTVREEAGLYLNHLGPTLIPLQILHLYEKQRMRCRHT